MTERKILITGGTGYVGSALVPALAKKYAIRVFCAENFGNPILGTENVEFVKGDIRDAGAMLPTLQDCTDVIHLAGIVTDDLVDMNRSYSEDVNVRATQILLGEAEAEGVERFIYMSSSSVYGSTAYPAIEEDECQPETAYAQTKLRAEEMCLEPSDMTVSAIRSATLCGPAPRMRLDTIVNIFSKQAFFDGRITVFGGSQIRSNIHVRDVVRFYETLLEAPADKINGEVFNLVHMPRTALQIAQMVSRMGRLYLPQYEDKDVPIDIDESKTDSRHYQMSAAKAKAVLDFVPTYALTQAVKHNFKFFQEGGLKDHPDADIYYNTRRMKEVVANG